MTIKENLEKLKRIIPLHVKIVAVSKTKPIEAIMEAYQSGHKVFGENKVQEIIEKQPQLPSDIEWHFIGHLQTNKVKFLAPFVHCIESVDSLKLLKEINKNALKYNRIINCFLQFHIASESTKFGLDYDEVKELLSDETLMDMGNIRITGVMGMATFIHDPSVIRKEFRSLKEIFLKLKNAFFTDDSSFNEISMGMSGDYELAIEEGSTNVRIGSAIFGER